MINYIFYWFSKLKVYQPIYWAKIFTPLIFVITIFPVGLTLSRFFFGCYDQKAIDGTIKVIMLLPAVAIVLLSDFYFSDERVRRIQAQYSGETKLKAITKLISIGLLLFLIFWYGSVVIRMFFYIPTCGSVTGI